MTEQQSQRIFDANIRLEKVVCLGMCGDYEALSDDAEAMLEDIKQVAEDTGINFVADERTLEDEDEDEDEDEEEDLGELARGLVRSGFTGFFAQFAQPVPTIVFGASGRKYMSYSWGYYGTRWFYGVTMDDLLEKAITWGERNWTEAREKAV